jgi:putative phage-type endonuclease
MLPTPEEREAFLLERQSGLGGSDIAAVIGADPFKTPLEVYYDKTRPIDTDDPMNYHMRRGILMEPLLAWLWETERELPTQTEPISRHPAEEWAMCHTDRKIYRYDNGQEAGVLEVKAPGRAGFQRVLDQGVSEAYIVQLQYSMWVTGRTWGSFAIGNLEHPEGPIVTADMERNQDLINQIVPVCRTFWHQNVLKGVPPSHVIPDPPPIPDISGEIVTISDDQAMWREQLAKIIEQHTIKKQAEALLKELKAEAALISTFVGSEKMAVPEGKVYVSWREGRKRFDRKLLEAHRPLDRDLVRRALLYSRSRPGSELDGIEALLIDCELDLSRFERQGDPYKDFRVYPAREK